MHNTSQDNNKETNLANKNDVICNHKPEKKYQRMDTRWLNIFIYRHFKMYDESI